MTMMLLEWVITSVFLILTVLALRAAFGRRVSARLRYALWAVVLVRLLVPVQLFTSPLAGTWVFPENRTEQTVTEWPITSDAHITPGPDDVLSPDVPDEPLTNFPAAPQAPEPPTAPIAAPPAPAAPDWTKLPAYLGWVWLGGSILLILVLAASNLRFALRLRRSRIPMEGTDCPLPVYAAVGLPSPCLFGLVRPAVYVTPEAAADPVMLRHVIAHEYTHFRQGDHLWSLLRCAALAAHWWNPLVWLAVKLSRRDGELACDEGALKRLGDGERLAYGNTLLALVTAKPGPGDLLCFATTMAGEKRSLKERISRIAHAPKRLLWAAVAVVLVTVLACACAFGSAEEPKQTDEPDAEPTSSATVGSDTNLPGFTPTYSMNWNGTVRLEGLGDANVEWLGPDADRLEFTDAAFCCPGLADRSVLGYASWTDETGTAMQVAVNIFDDRMELQQTGCLVIETPVGFFLRFSVELDSGTVLDRNFTSYIEGETLELTDREMADMARVLAKLLTGAEEYYQSHIEQRGQPVQELQSDLDHDGVSETVQITQLDGGAGLRLELWDDGELIWSDEGYYAHAGYNAVFLCTLDGKDYLLRYNPYMGQGWCNYSYELFTLTRDGKEQAAQQNSVTFDVNFGVMHESFDPEAIAAFMDEINGLLAHSVQLINTDDDLLAAFRAAGRLYDGRWWLDPSVSMLESLRAYKADMEVGTNYQSVLLGRSRFMLIQDEAGYYVSIDDVPALISKDDPYVKISDFTVVDMDGDGADEVLVWVCGVTTDFSGYLLLRQENGTVCGTIVNAQTDRSDYWLAAVEAYKGKPDAVWHEFNEENIAEVFMKG